jgi:hypothetical protein
MVRLTFEHWELSRGNMERFIVPERLTSEAWKHLDPEPARKSRLPNASTLSASARVSRRPAKTASRTR